MSKGHKQSHTSKSHAHDGHHHHDHGHDGHEHKAAPMVDEITDYEVLEIAVRELAIEHGLFTAEDHRKFTEWAEAVGPAAGSRLVAKAWTDPAFKARVLEDATKACKEIGVDWVEPTGFGTPSDYTKFSGARRYPDAASCDRLHALLVLSAPGARHVARMVSLD
jgi:thiocyanate hydrolase subunit gamma